MMKYLRIALACLVFSMSWVFAQETQETLTNESIITMVGMKLDDEVVIAKIRASKNSFDTSTQGFAQLQRGNVSGAVIQAMIETSGPQSAQRASRIPDGEFLAHIDGQYSLLPGVAVTTNKSNGEKHIPIYGNYAPKRSSAVLAGKTAPTRTSEHRPVFYSRVEPSRLKLFLLGEKSDSRYIRFTNGASNRELQFVVEPAEKGLYRITPVQDLKAGEYAFFATPRASDSPQMASPFGMVLAMSMVFNTPYLTYSFGIDDAKVARR